MLDFCDLVGTVELAEPTGMTLLGNPIQVGEALVISDLPPGLVSVRNSTGALISTGSVSTPPVGIRAAATHTGPGAVPPHLAST
jgi:hypothetical protein